MDGFFPQISHIVGEWGEKTFYFKFYSGSFTIWVIHSVPPQQSLSDSKRTSSFSLYVSSFLGSLNGKSHQARQG